MKVFRKMKFYDYDESRCDSSWSYDDILMASSLYATCKDLGYDEDLSYSLVYMYVSKLHMPGLKYPDMYEKKLTHIMRF